MSKFETRFKADDDADAIRAAFYDFVERHADDKTVDGDAHISAEIDRQGSRLRVRLWSAEAMETFLTGLDCTVVQGQRLCFE
jgi:hypothetical protein